MEPDILQSIDPRELGRRLQEARKARGLTQQETADHLGAARTTITVIEKGERRAQPIELARLAELYGRSVGEFLRRGKPIEPFAVQLRAVLAPDSAVEDEIAAPVAEFRRLCEDYLDLERICRAPLPQRYPPPYEIGGVPPEVIAEDVATTERNRLGLGDGPIPDLRELLEGDVGLRIFYMDLPSRVAAMFVYTDQAGGCIAVNCKHPEERRRLSLAHDYGHFLTSRYRPEVTFLGQYRRQPEHERFAEALARFVSVEALTRRLEELRLLPMGTWDRLQQAGFRVREAQALLQLPQRRAADQLLPMRYLYLAAEAFERGDLSEGQLARFLRVDRLEARRVTTELANGPVVSDEGTVGTLPLDLGETLPVRGA